jgi:hypothetical protein
MIIYNAKLMAKGADKNPVVRRVLFYKRGMNEGINRKEMQNLRKESF